MTENHQLLADFVQNGSDAAFRELVARYINFVYSTALRLMDGDRHLAEDVTQTVFIQLAKNASKLSREPMLGGWLHRVTFFVASKMRRSEQRRQAREREAALMDSLQDHSDSNMEKLAPILDEAINQLGNEDRNAILLRFFEQRNFQSVGAALGSNEDAARQRVRHALQKLQGILARRGVTLSAAALGTTLAAGTVSAAPTALVGTVISAALTSVAGAATTTTLIHTLTMAKMNSAIIAPLLVAGVAGILLVHNYNAHQTALRLKDDQIAQLQKEKAPVIAAPPAPADDSNRELLQLRGEVGVLKKQLANALSANPNPNQGTQGTNFQLNEVEQRYMEKILRQQYLTRLQMSHARNWMLGFIMHAQDHEGRLPTNFSQAASYLGKNDAGSSDEKNDTLLMATNNFQIVYNGSIYDLPNNHVVVLRSAPIQNIPGDASGGWTKVYGFADGSVQSIQSADGDFEKWEKENMVGRE